MTNREVDAGPKMSSNHATDYNRPMFGIAPLNVNAAELS
jgi:hypothetical protein